MIFFFFVKVWEIICVFFFMSFRFACRIIAGRDESDLTCRIFAAGFDSSRNIFLVSKSLVGERKNPHFFKLFLLVQGEKATKWETNGGADVDGLVSQTFLI